MWYYAGTTTGYTSLDVSGFTKDSLRVKLGASLNWDSKLHDIPMHLSLNAAFSRELKDSRVHISARNISSGTYSSFSSDEKATSENSLQLGPSVELDLTQTSTLSFSYSFEPGFNHQTAHHFGAMFKMRF
jgi:uncharacterized protein with beta-barrel porin domain